MEGHHSTTMAEYGRRYQDSTCTSEDSRIDGWLDLHKLPILFLGVPFCKCTIEEPIPYSNYLDR